MFLTADEGPVASGRGEAASQATLRYIQAVDVAVRGLWTAHADAIKRRCAAYMPKGLLDQQEVFGFALADGLNRPLIPGDRARDVGQAGDDAMKGAKGTVKRPGPLVRAKEAAREAVRKATRAAEKDAELSGGIEDAGRNGAAAVALVLDKTYDLKLPNETVGAKRKLAAISAIAQVEPVEPEPEQPSREELVSAVKKAQTALDRAKQVARADELRVERAQRRLDALGPYPDGKDVWDQARLAVLKPRGIGSLEEHDALLNDYMAARSSEAAWSDLESWHGRWWVIDGLVAAELVADDLTKKAEQRLKPAREAVEAAQMASFESQWASAAALRSLNSADEDAQWPSHAARCPTAGPSRLMRAQAGFTTTTRPLANRSSSSRSRAKATHQARAP